MHDYAYMAQINKWLGFMNFPEWVFHENLLSHHTVAMIISDGKVIMEKVREIKMKEYKLYRIKYVKFQISD